MMFNSKSESCCMLWIWGDYDVTMQVVTNILTTLMCLMDLFQYPKQFSDFQWTLSFPQISNLTFFCQCQVLLSTSSVPKTAPITVANCKSGLLCVVSIGWLLGSISLLEQHSELEKPILLAKSTSFYLLDYGIIKRYNLGTASWKNLAQSQYVGRGQSF